MEIDSISFRVSGFSNTVISKADTVVSKIINSSDSISNTATHSMTADTVEVLSSAHGYALTQNSFKGLLIVGVVFAALVLISWVMKVNWKTSLWRFINKRLVVFMIIVWCMGFCTYYVGTHVPLSHNHLSVVPMSVIHATEMFFGMNDISAIQNDCKNSASYMFFFGLSHLLAVLLGLMFLVRLFGHHISSRIKLWCVSVFCFWKKNKPLYIFYGLNDKSFMLASKINAGGNVLIIRTCADVKNDMSKTSVSKQMDVMKMSEDEHDQLNKLKCLTTTTTQSLAALDLKGRECRVIHDKLGLWSVARLIKKRKEVSIFFMGEDELANISAMLNLSSDTDLNKYPDRVYFYCHARKNSATDVRLMRDRLGNEKFKCRIIDSSEKAVELLKKDITTHPVNFMNVDVSKAAVTTEFNACIIGFGETGQEALSYLYEFSALPKENGEKMPVHFTLIDEMMDRLEGTFRMQHPWFDDAGHNDELTFKACKVGSLEYTEYIKDNIDKLNYVVVSLDDDNLNLETALNVFDYAYHYRRGGLKDFVIFVRSYSQTNYDDMKRILSNYNNSLSEGKEILRLFGAIDEIFTVENIISDEVLNNAKLFHHSYKNGKENPEKTWEDDFYKVDKIMKERQCCKLAALKENETKMFQNIENYMHIGTKFALMGLKAGDVKEMERLIAEFEKREENTTMYWDDEAKGIKSIENARLNNMAKCEHLRWMASHIMMGFVFGEKNYQTMTHDCLIPWDDISSEETKSYDNKVFEVSVRIMMNKARFVGNDRNLRK